MNDDARFDVFFAGECLDGHGEAEVRAALGKLFNADPATLERLFSGKRQLVKRDCDHATALKYQRAMKAAGARPIIAPRRETVDAAVPGDGAAAAPAATTPEPPAGGEAFSLAPSGTGVLRPEERRVVEAPEIDTGHLSDAPVGERLQPEREVTPQVAAPDYQVAEAGTSLSDPSDAGAAAAQPPAGDTLSLAEGEFDLSDCAPAPVAPPEVDLEHLGLAAAGSELLEASERRHDTATAPDTSHLSLSAEDPER